MSAKWMKAVNIRSSLSKRENILLKPFESPKQSLYFVATAIHDSVVFPRVYTALLGWHDRRESEVEDQLPCFSALIRPVHDHAHLRLYRFQRA